MTSRRHVAKEASGGKKEQAAEPSKASRAGAARNRPVKKDERRMIGRLGENAATDYLVQAGYTIIERNWRCRSGEIDIIASHGTEASQLVFVEVRTRRSGGRFGTAAESIDLKKRRQVMETAQVYMRMKGLEEMPVRFDAIAITLQGMSVIELNHYEAAL